MPHAPHFLPAFPPKQSLMQNLTHILWHSKQQQQQKKHRRRSRGRRRSWGSSRCGSSCQRISGPTLRLLFMFRSVLTYSKVMFMFSFLCLERGSPSEGRGATEGASLLIVYTKCSEAYVSSPPKILLENSLSSSHSWCDWVSFELCPKLQGVDNLSLSISLADKLSDFSCYNYNNYK